MQNTTIKKLVRLAVIGVIGSGLLAACGGNSDQSNGGNAKLLANGEACAAAWVSTTVYANAGTKVSRLGVNYTNNWWTQGEDPSTNNGGPGTGKPWTAGFTCGGGVTTTTAATTSTTKATTTTTKAGTTTTSTPATTSTTKASTTTTTKASTTTTTTASTTTTTGTPGTLAKHALVGYWHNFTNPAGPTFPISQVSNSWDVIVVSFADNAGSGNVSFTLDPAAGTEAQFIQDIQNKRAQGKKVVLSLGGQNGSVSVGSSAEATNFANSLYAIITKYGFDGIDLDLENGVAQGAAIQTYLPIAVKSLKAKVGSSFYLSMAPEWVYVEGGYTAYGSIWGAYIPIINALRNELTIIHPQYYNNGDVYTPYQAAAIKAGSANQLVATAKMLIEGFTYGGNNFAGLRPDQVGFGVPSGSSSANSGFTTSTDVNNALDCLTKLQNCGSIRPNQAYPTFRGVMTWSINWDKHDGFNFSGPIAPHLHALP